MATVNKNLSLYDKNKIPEAKYFRFGVVVAEWNEAVTERLYEGVQEAFLENGVPLEQIIRWNVPGSFELVYGCKKMLQTQNVDAVIAIGCVIQGETKHFDFVCDGVAQGIKDLNVQTDIPVIFCVLTDNTIQQSIDRSGGIHGNKGIEAAIAAIKMAFIRRQASLTREYDSHEQRILALDKLQLGSAALKIEE